MNPQSPISPEHQLLLERHLRQLAQREELGKVGKITFPDDGGARVRFVFVYTDKLNRLKELGYKFRADGYTVAFTFFPRAVFVNLPQPSDVNATPLRVGQRVFVRISSRRYDPDGLATITRINGASVWVTYDDGEQGCVAASQIDDICIEELGEWSCVDNVYVPNNLRGFTAIRSIVDAAIEDRESSLSNPGNFVAMPKSVAEAFANALIAIDQFAPQERPEEPDYAALQSNLEVIAAASAYSIALTAWALAQHARQALAFANIAAQETAPDEDAAVKLGAQS